VPKRLRTKQCTIFNRWLFPLRDGKQNVASCSNKRFERRDGPPMVVVIAFRLYDRINKYEITKRNYAREKCITRVTTPPVKQTSETEAWRNRKNPKINLVHLSSVRVCIYPDPWSSSFNYPRTYKLINKIVRKLSLRVVLSSQTVAFFRKIYYKINRHRVII